MSKYFLSKENLIVWLPIGLLVSILHFHGKISFKNIFDTFMGLTPIYVLLAYLHFLRFLQLCNFPYLVSIQIEARIIDILNSIVSFLIGFSICTSFFIPFWKDSSKGYLFLLCFNIAVLVFTMLPICLNLWGEIRDKKIKYILISVMYLILSIASFYDMTK